MTSVIVVDKGGVVKETTVKLNNKDNITNRYSPKSKLGKSGYNKKATWNVKINGVNNMIELWATDKGRAGSENNYDFPPPVDTTLYFGNCLLLKVENDGSDVTQLTKEEWEKIYEKLFGGFEDLGSEEPSEDELEKVPEEMKTKAGYLKDGFVVADDDEEDESYDDENDNEEEAVSSNNSDEDEPDYHSGEGSESETDNGSELGSEDYDYDSE